VLHEVLDLASEVTAEPIDRFGPRSVSLLVEDLRQGHSVESGRSRNFADADPTPFSELLLLNLIMMRFGVKR